MLTMEMQHGSPRLHDNLDADASSPSTATTRLHAENFRTFTTSRGPSPDRISSVINSDNDERAVIVHIEEGHSAEQPQIVDISDGAS
jgi:hypothetical protein